MTRMLQWIALALACCACVVAQAAQGEVKVPSPAARVSRELVEQKQTFLQHVLSDSPAAKRIVAGNNAEAKKYFAGAQESYSKALISIRNNDISSADRQLNDATWLIGKARQLVPDPQTRDVEHQMRYARMLDSVESLRISYQRHLQRIQGKPPGIAVHDARIAKAARLVDGAKSLANSGQIQQANKALGDAEQALMAGLSRVLGTKTIEYSQRFETLAEEYAYELERNRSYGGLIPIALAEFKPGSEAIREVHYLSDSNRKLLEQAQQHANRKDHRAALTALRSGTTHLQGALAAAGLRVPQDPKPE